MKHYGLEIPEGSNITNATVSSGVVFPSNPNLGELFVKTAGSPPNVLWHYDGSDWVSASNVGGFAPLGPTGAIQYNNGGLFDANVNLTFDDANNTLNIGGSPGDLEISHDGVDALIANSTGDLNLTATAITLNGVAATDFAQLSAENVYTRSEAGGNAHRIINTSTDAASFTQFDLTGNDATLTAYITPTNRASGVLTDGPTSGAQGVITTRSTFPLVLGTNDTARVIFTSGGQAQFVNATGNSEPAISIRNANPTLHWYETDAASDNRIWALNVRSEQLLGLIVNDANDAANIWLTVDRTNTTVDSVALTATSITLNGVAASDFVRLSQENTITASDAGLYRQAIINTSTAVGASADLRVTTGSSDSFYGTTSQNNTSATWTGGPTSAHVYLGTNTAIPISIGTSSSERMRINSSGTLRFNAYGAGTLTTDASGNVTASSDVRLKTGITDFGRGIEAILALNPVLFGYTVESNLDQTKTDYVGFIADEVQEVIPEAVGVTPGSPQFLTMSDRPIIAALVNAIKDLTERLDQLEDQLTQLQNP